MWKNIALTKLISHGSHLGHRTLNPGLGSLSHITTLKHYGTVCGMFYAEFCCTFVTGC
jgi:hypothetical protein